MGYGLTNHLLALCGGVFAASLLVTWRRLGAWPALTVTSLRVLIPLLYFAWYFDGQWTFYDDLEYVEHGEYLLDQGFTPLSVLTAEGRNTMHSLAGGFHVAYSWWNLLTMWLFGAYYYVPVLANVFITFCSAHLLSQLLAELRFSAPYRRTLQVLYLVHWDTIAWSSIVNLKDPIVQLMTIAFFLSAIRVVRHRSWTNLAICAGLLLGFHHLRFYVPYVIGAAAVSWIFLQWKDVRKYPLLAAAVLVGVWLLPGRAYQLWDAFSPFEVAYGITRFVLTPQPWDISESYSFLLMPTTLHWIMIVPALVGGVSLWNESPPARLILLYAAIMVLMYALADEIQGARQRAQLSFVFTWMQMHFLWQWTHVPTRQVVPAPVQMSRAHRINKTAVPAA